MKRIAVYAHFNENGGVALHIYHYLKEIRSLGFEICFVSNSSVFPEDKAKLSALCEKLIQRDNAGFDFCMWKAGLAEYELSEIEELLLTNSSIIGPLRPLKSLWENPKISKCDFWGLTDNDEIGYHLQSYFMVFKRQVLHSEPFVTFWQSILPYKNKQHVIRNYEVGLTPWLEENGFKWAAIFSQEHLWSLFLRRRTPVKKFADWYRRRGLPGRNTTTLLPDLLLECGMPFIKAALLREAPFQASPKVAFELLESSNLPSEILTELSLKKAFSEPSGERRRS